MTDDRWIEFLKKEFEQERQEWLGLSSEDSRRVLGEMRDKHFAQFLKKGLPLGSDKWWQFTYVQNILRSIFQNAERNNVSDRHSINEELIADFPDVNRLHFHNGQLVEASIDSGLQWCTWDQLNADFPCWSWLVDCFRGEKKVAGNGDGLFHLAGAFPSGYILFVPDGYESSKALHIHSVFAAESAETLGKLNLHNRDMDTRNRAATTPFLKDEVVISSKGNPVQKLKHAFCREADLQLLLAQSRTRFEQDSPLKKRSHNLQSSDNNVNAAAAKSLPLGGWNFIFMGKGARLTLVENISHYGQVVVNTVSNVYHSEQSALRWIRVEQGSGSSCYFNQSISEMEKESSIDRLHFSLGSRFSRDRADVVHVGEKARSTLLGLSILKNKNQSDHRFNVHHLKPGGYSRQFCRGILNNESKGIFHGRVHVESWAKGVDCSQSAKNLLLSDRAHSCIQPELAIDCSEVQAQHGSAVGNFDPNEIFYLQTRGLDMKSAWELLIFAYIKDVLHQFPADSCLEHLNQMIHRNKSVLLNLANEVKKAQVT